MRTPLLSGGGPGRPAADDIATQHRERWGKAHRRTDKPLQRCAEVDVPAPERAPIESDAPKSPPAAAAHHENRDVIDPRPFFTTGDAAHLCGVSQQTIIRCFDRGLLRGYRVPGSHFRRIPRDAMIEFMQRNGIPIHRLAGQKRKHRVLIVDTDVAWTRGVVESVGNHDAVEVEAAATAYDAGACVERSAPDMVIINPSMSDCAGGILLDRIHNNPRLIGTMYVLVGDTTPISGRRKDVVADFTDRPAAANVAALILQLFHLEAAAKPG